MAALLFASAQHIFHLVEWTHTNPSVMFFHILLTLLGQTWLSWVSLSYSWSFDPILLHSLVACQPCLVIFYSFSIDVIRRFKKRYIVQMDALNIRKNNWDKSGMIFMLIATRDLKLMWPIWSCCMMCCTSQASSIFYNFPSLNPSLKSRLPNIVLYISF